MSKQFLATITVFVDILIGCTGTSATRQPLTTTSGGLPSESVGTPTPTNAEDEQSLETRVPELAIDGRTDRIASQSKQITTQDDVRNGCGLILPIIGDEKRYESSQIADDFDDTLVPGAVLPALQRIVS